ncbi:alpha/beta hydrolase [Aureliella helgolandensis]|nr:alpha/beta hydrolase [Aureliella helgolandensis]
MHRLLRSTYCLAWFVVVNAVASLPAYAQAPSDQTPRLQRATNALEGVIAHRDVAYVKDGDARQRLDLYLPDATEPLPVIVWVHGGGWQSGSKNGCPPLRAGYTKQGYAVASIGYRLSGQAPFPAQIEDCKAAIRWIRAHADEFNLDRERIGVWGSSAGGHLAALVGTSGGFEEFDVGQHLDQSSAVQAVCDYYGPTDFKVFVQTPHYERHAETQSPESKLLGGAVLLNPDKVKRVNPMTYIAGDDPSFLIVHGDRDATVPLNQSELLFKALKNAGVPVHFHTIQGAGHGGPAFNEPGIGEMVRDFWEHNLKQLNTERPQPSASTSESRASETPNPGQAPPRGSGRSRLKWENVVAAQDHDQDGRISEEEFRGGAMLWKRLDRNGDGFVSESEHRTAFPGRSASE